MARYHPPRAAVRYRLLAVVASFAIARAVWLSLTPAPDAPLTEGEHLVARVIDGDTIVLTSKRRVRLQGIDTPEVARNGHPGKPWSAEATRFTQKFVDRAGGRVRLTFTDERLDRYDRVLAFVWSEDICLNEELVREGLAKARLDYRFTGIMRTRLRNAQDEAKASGAGIWRQ